jgi:stage V sporulation protein B
MASAPEAERDGVARRAVAVQIVSAIPLVLLFTASAPVLAKSFWHVPELALPLAIIGGVLFFYSLYAPLVGVVNGRRRYAAQAGLDALFTTLRTVALISGALLLRGRGLGVEGALGGFVIAAGIIFVVALFVAGTGARGATTLIAREHLSFVLPLFGGQFALNLLFQSDLQLLTHFAGAAARTASIDAEQVKQLVGAYRASQLFCFLPYQLLMSITLVLFPLLASAARDSDRATVTRLVNNGVRLACLIAGLLVSINASLSARLLRLVFGSDAAELGGRAMSVLSIGLGAFAIFGILSTVLTSLKRERLSATLTLVALASVVSLCFALLNGEPFGAKLLMKTAAATTIGMFAATAMTARAVHKEAGSVLPIASVARIAAAVAIAIGCGRALSAWAPPGKIATIALAPGVALIYAALLIVTRELRRDDARFVLRVLGRS